jgi:hypothetical protein
VNELWIQDITPCGDFDWQMGRYLFTKAILGGEIQTVKLWISLDFDCDIDIWIRYDPHYRYNGLGDDRDPVENELWNESQCCHWRIESSNCDRHSITLVSWVELDEDGIPFIYIEIDDHWTHDECDNKEEDIYSTLLEF